MKWQVTYTKKGVTIIKIYSSMRTATSAVEKLMKRGVAASCEPLA